MDQAFTDAKQYGWSKNPIVEMLIPSTVDSTLAPEGKHVASLFCQQFANCWQNKEATCLPSGARVESTVDGISISTIGFLDQPYCLASVKA